jgi:pilus assembly protein CpaF
MSILDQVKRTRFARPQPDTSSEKALNAAAPTSAEVAVASPVQQPPASVATRLPSYGIQPAVFENDAGSESPEWTSSVNRSLRLQSERRDAHEDLKSRIHEELIAELDPAQLAGDTSPNSPIRRAVEVSADERLVLLDAAISRPDRLRLASEIADEVLGYGPLEPLLRDPGVTELMVNAWDRIFYERAGAIQLSEYRFRDDNHILNVIDKMLRPLGRRLDESSPMVDARLPDGSRINAIIPPLAIKGPSLTIRKFSRDLLGAEDLVRLGTFTRPAVTLLSACVRGRLNILVSGGTGTGKTTLLNVLSDFIPARERLVSIEDPAELQLKHIDWVSLETRPANVEGRGEITPRDLVRNALRMRPDRIIVGECRGGEAFDMLQAMNTGHDGSLTTVHANTPRDALARVENMVLMAVDLPMQAVREQVASGINLVVQIARLQDGTRRITHISEIVGSQGTMVTLQDLFVFQHQGIGPAGEILGTLHATGLRPRFMERLAQNGEHLPVEIFLANAAHATESDPNGSGARRSGA